MSKYKPTKVPLRIKMMRNLQTGKSAMKTSQEPTRGATVAWVNLLDASSGPMASCNGPIRRFRS